MDVMLFEKTTRRSSSLPEYMYTSFLLFNSEMFSEIIPILRVYADAQFSVFATTSSCNASRESVSSGSDF